MSETGTTLEEVETTEAFQNLSFIRQRIIRKWINIQGIDHDLKIATHIGIEAWEKTSPLDYLNRNIVIELFKNQL